VLIRHLWQLKTVVFLHWCIICTVLLKKIPFNLIENLKKNVLKHFWPVEQHRT
jgi:hypothetical protein